MAPGFWGGHLGRCPRSRYAGNGRRGAEIRRYTDLHNPGESPRFDAQREETYATTHSSALFYSVLIRINPNDPESTSDIVCDLCTKVPQPTDSGTTYTFKIRDNGEFHNGDTLAGDRVGGISS